MIRRFLHKIRTFRRKEDGNATIEFVFWFPIFIMTTYSAVEVGIGSFNLANLERALDETIRDVRLNNLEKYTTNTDDGWTHTILKDAICDKAAVVSNCKEMLALEMTRVDPFVGNTLDPNPFCVDTPASIRQNQIFVPGASDELMIVRACLEVKPLWWGTTMGIIARQNPNGIYELHATTVFVYEPT